MRSRTARIVGVALCAATSLAACSGGSEKEDFVAAADDVCRDADERIAEIRRLRGKKGVLEYVDQAKGISADLVADLRELEPPEGDTTGVEEMIDGVERATNLLEPLAQATLDQDADEVRELQQEVRQITDDVSELAESYGFEVCGAKVFEPVR